MTVHLSSASLAAIADDVLGAVLRAAAARVAPSTPGLAAVAHRRERTAQACDWQEGGRPKRAEVEHWFLHVGVTLDGPAADDPRPVEDAHPALARELRAEAARWADCWAILHRHRRGDPALAAYHRVALDVVVPPAPPAHPRLVFIAAHAAERGAARRPEPEAPKPAAVAAPAEQRGLFG